MPRKANPDKSIPGTMSPKAGINKARTIYKGFPKELIDAGYNQGLITSISTSPIKNQAEFNTRVSYLEQNEHIPSLIKLVKSKNDGGIGFTPTHISNILSNSGDDFGKAIDALANGVNTLKALEKSYFTPLIISFILKDSGQEVGLVINALKIINVANLGRSNPISTGILANLLTKLPKQTFFDIKDSNVESILSELETKDPFLLQASFALETKNHSPQTSSSLKTKNHSPQASFAYEGFPKELIDAGYNQGLITSISTSPIKNQAEFNRRVRYLEQNEHIPSLIKLVKSKENGGIGFNAENITSILFGSGQKFGDAINALNQKVDNLKPFLDKVSEGGLGFTPSNISSILRGSGQKLGNTIDALTNGYEALKKLLAKVEDGGAGFTPANISSILSGSGQNVGLAIDALTSTERVDKLKKLLTPVADGGIGFTPENISSILSGSGQNAGKTIDALTNGYEALKKLLAKVEDGGAGFTPANISSILSGSGQNVGKAIDALEIINVANQGRSNPISTKILTNFLVPLRKTKLIKIDTSNVESILSELEKTKLRDPSSQVPSAGAPSSNDPSPQVPSAGAPSYFQTHGVFDFNTHSAGLGIDDRPASKGEGHSSSKSQEPQTPPEAMALSESSKRKASDKPSKPDKKKLKQFMTVFQEHCLQKL